MQKISNSVTGRTVLPSLGVTLLTFANVSQVVFSEATAQLTAEAFEAWKADPANATARVITVTEMICDDGDAVKLLVEYTTEAVTEPTNDVISQTTFSSAPDTDTVENLFQTWKLANPYEKVIRTTKLVGIDGNVILIVEHGTDSTITSLENYKISQVFFQDSGEANTSYSQYVTWKAANPSLKPIRLTYIVNNDGTVGILVEYTVFGSTPSVGQLLMSFVANSASGTFASNLQAHKTLYPGYRIYRVTAVYQGFLIEYTTNGITPVNSTVSQSDYSIADATYVAADYEAFKGANPTLVPIRLTAMTWGDGTNTLVAEYI